MGRGTVEPGDGARSLGVPALLGVVAVYLAILVVGGRLGAASVDGFEYGRFPDTETVVLVLLLPVAASVVFAVAVVSVLRWWPPVLVEHRPVQRWVRIVPILMLVAVVGGTDYGTLIDEGAAFTLVLLVASLLVGVGEELVFRGVTVTALRVGDRPEWKVALWSSVLFGAAHSVNLLTEGGSILQVVVTTVAGYFFYLVRRVSGGIVVPALLHGLWDFGLFSGGVTDEVYAGGVLFLFANVVMAVVLLVRRRRIEPVPAGG